MRNQLLHHRHWSWPTILVCVGVALLHFGAVPPVSATADTGPAIYLPAAYAPPPAAVHGLFLVQGQPGAGIVVTLRKWDGASWSVVASTVTDAGGAYRFEHLAALPPDQKYQVRYMNGTDGNPANPALMWYCRTASVAGYNGEDIYFADIELADVVLRVPHDYATLGIPASFGWTPRGISSERYYLLLRGLNGGPSYASSSLGYAAAYALDQLPAGFSYDMAYAWLIGVQGKNASYQCESYYFREITFRR